METANYEAWQGHKGLWTAELKAALKKADYVVVRFHEVCDAPWWRRDAKWCELEFHVRGKSRSEETQYITAWFRGSIGNGYLNEVVSRPMGDFGTSYNFSTEPENLYKPSRGVWGTALFPGQTTHARSILESLTVGSELEFKMALDYGGSDITRKAGLHADLMLLRAVKGSKRKEFTLEKCVCEHNPARFGNGLGDR